MKVYLLTWHGYFLSTRGRAAIRLRPGKSVRVEDVFYIELPTEDVGHRYSEFLSQNHSFDLEINLPSTGAVNIRTQETPNIVALERDGKFVTAMPDGSLRCEQEWLHGWERFILIDEASLSIIEEILNNKWVLLSSRKIINGTDVEIDVGHALKIGQGAFPLAQNMPFNGSLLPFQVPLFREGWKYDRLLRYRPLIYYVAFGQNTIDQLCVSLISLLEIGRYRGDILIFTDFPIDFFYDRIGQQAVSQITVSTLPATDWVGYVAGKYAILEEKDAYECSPVVYMDPDIVFNADITDMLVDMVSSSTITAPLEHFSKLSTSPSVGAQLLQLDGGAPSIACGFNAGTLGIPNLRDHGHVLQTIRQTIRNFISLNGRSSLRYVDQEAANYISYKFAHVDTTKISRYARIGWIEDANDIGLLTGLVHFCGISRIYRVEPMQKYLELLRAHYSGSVQVGDKD